MKIFEKTWRFFFMFPPPQLWGAHFSPKWFSTQFHAFFMHIFHGQFALDESNPKTSKLLLKKCKKPWTIQSSFMSFFVKCNEAEIIF